MLVFIDESGDPGLKVKNGASRYFVIGLTAFEDKEEALACDQRIGLLRIELNKSKDFEFHFKKNSNKIREAFLRAVAPYNFFYYVIAINKAPDKLWGNGFKDKSSFYKYTCSLVFENAKDKLEDAIVVMDKSGDLEFRRQLSKYLKTKMNTRDRKIRKIKQQRSESNNLIQLADYITGVVARNIQNKKDGDLYRKIISHREIYVQIWPK